jgi:hypothetical protein
VEAPVSLRLVPRRSSNKSSRTLSTASLSTITRIATKATRLALTGHPWQLAVIENLLDQMLQRVQKQQGISRAL